jgi:hypothetical protein
MVLSPDFSDFIRSLDANGVRYLVVGGYAVAFHGHPRYTKDIDVWIDRTEENADRLMQALASFGFGAVGLRRDDFLVEDQVVQLGQPPQRIDLITTLPGVEFGDCYPRRVEVSIEDLNVCFIDIESLRIANRASGRHQDLADLENLQ